MTTVHSLAPDRRRYCLVTSAHVTNNPRLVKEADALRQAGAEVRVVSLASRAPLIEVDRALAAERGWRLQHVDGIRGGAHPRRWLLRAAVHRAALRLFDAGVPGSWLAERAASRMSRDLARAGVAEPADVVIAHNLEALPAAGAAATALGASLGFDAEDLHSEEASEAQGAAQRRRLATAIESRWLPRCQYVTASSIGIAQELAARYGIPRPQVVLNVFPRALRDRQVPRDRATDRPTVYWYSQTIGRDRGIEEALAAIAGLPIPVELHLRGLPDAGYREHLEARAAALSLAPDRLVFHPVAPADDLVALAAQHDVGLAAEQPICLNRQICATNKLFTYLLAGNAIAATDTPGQRAILEQCPGASILYAHADVAGLTAGLWALFASPARLARARAAALEAALQRFTWEHEAPRLVAYLSGARADAVRGRRQR